MDNEVLHGYIGYPQAFAGNDVVLPCDRREIHLFL
jgi:hypothetical protein